MAWKGIPRHRKPHLLLKSFCCSYYRDLTIVREGTTYSQAKKTLLKV